MHTHLKDVIDKRLTALNKTQLTSLISTLWKQGPEVTRRLIETSLIRGDPDAYEEFLATQIDDLLGDTRSVSAREAPELAHALRAIHDQLVEWLDAEPERCWSLTDQLVRGDAAVLKRVDDAKGLVAAAFSDLCLLWLKSAAGCDQPAGFWAQQLLLRHHDDTCHSRAALLTHADRLLDPDSLKGMYQAALQTASLAEPGDFEGFDFCETLKQLAWALKDPALYFHAIMHFFSVPSPAQRLDAARVFLEFGQPGSARTVLTSIAWPTRLRSNADELLARALQELGDQAALMTLRRRQWRDQPNLWTLKALVDLASDEEAEEIVQAAVTVAPQDPDVVRGAGVLLFLGFYDQAESLLVGRTDELATVNANRLRALAKLIPQRESPLCQTLLYRALLVGVLNRGRPSSYARGVQYFKRLKLWADRHQPSWGVPTHDVFQAELWLKYGRKHEFWKRVE